MIANRLTRWLWAPVLTGPSAIFGALLAVAIPTVVRAAVIGVVTGCEFTPYLPFVLLSAILLGWWQASLVALASVGILGGLFVGPSMSHIAKHCFLSGAGIFLAASAIIIVTVVAIRRTVGGRVRTADEGQGGVVFSLDDGQVWASWYGQGQPVRLGSQERVGEMMEDFLAQVELGRRFSRRR